MKKFLLVLLSLGLVGCATAGHLATPSGRPEVIIQGVTKKDVIDASVESMLFLVEIPGFS